MPRHAAFTPDPRPSAQISMNHARAIRRLFVSSGLLLALLGIQPVADVVPGASALAAQQVGPRPLELADYATWRSISGSTLSDDGNWVAWSYSLVRGDDTLHVRSVDGATTWSVPRGSGPVFSDDGRWMAYEVALPFDEIERLERSDDPTPVQAGLMSLATGETRSWENASGFGFAPGSSHFHVRREASDDDADHDGTDLILRNLGEGVEELIGSVDQVAYNDGGSHLAFTVDAADQEGNGLYLVNLSTNSRRTLDNARERYARMTWSEDGASLAVLRGKAPDDMDERENRLLAFSALGGQRPSRVEFASTDGLAEGWVLSEKSALVWDADASTLFVATRPQQASLDSWPRDAFPLADVNIWRWNDDRIQTEQRRSAARDGNQTWVAAAHLASRSIVPIADKQMQTAEIARSGDWAVGRDDSAYISDWEPALADYYRVDTRTGARTQILEGQLRAFGLSPDSRNWLYWKDGQIWNYEIEADRHVNLTAAGGVDFTDQEFDYFGERPPYGVGGWTEDGQGVLLYDRYDVWLQPLNGRPATNLTGGRGAQDEIQLRIVRTDPEARTVNLREPVLLEGYGEWTKDEGFFRLDDGDLEQLTWEANRFGYPQKAADADRFLYTVQSWTDFPDLWVSDEDFADRTRMTEANPQQAEYAWGSRILFDYTDGDGVPLQGTLAIPDGYQPGQKLPMIVRFYEQYSQDLHAYPQPAYRHQPNFAGYVSNGYLLMMPDIHFRVGSSHSDMLESVEAAVQAVIDLGYVDPDRVGLSGHSYSGGGGAYIATRSNMFAAIAHGAAPINLVSEFNQLFVGSGQNNHSYDIYGQGRYATNPYDDFDLYWDQSPISGVETMNTPVLYLHGEADPTVNFEQGLEWFNALRFLKKPIIWLSYPGEGHGLSRLENRIDFQARLRQFFDHHLKGAPAPSWMTDGVPYLDKEQHQRDFAPQIFNRGEPADTTRSGSGG